MVTLTEATDLRILAKCAQVPVETLQSLNPSLRRLMTPPRPFELKIPAASLQEFQARLDAVPAEEKIAVALHRVERGESLAGIARAYKSSPEAIRLANRLPSRKVSVGQSLVVPLGTAASDPSLYAEDGRWRGRGSKVYKVRPGESLYAISRKTGVPISDLRSLNHLTGDDLHPGQRLVLAESAAPGRERGGAKPARSPSGGERVHHVQPGDTLWDLARKYGSSVDRICRANRISPGHRLQLGDTLVIP
jgi:membrane-bound lytic murein transglycosylase D